MSTRAEAEEPLPDPGALPAWGVGELPAPVKFSGKAILAALGPGIIMLGGSIGTGEWLLGPVVTARFQGQMLWLATLAIILQSFLNTECIRYALYTGEPVFTGYLRTKPGPRFWSGIYMLCDAGMFFPAFAGSLAQLLVAAYLGEGNIPGPQHAIPIMWVGIAVSLVGYVLMLFGGKIFNMLLACMTAKIIWVLGFLCFVDFFLVGWDKWQILLQGFFFPFKDGRLMIPASLTLPDWASIAGFAAFAGAGGLSNATFSNYAREKGWGMGALVGCIPSAVGGAQIQLSPLGTIFRPTVEAMRRWKLWWQYVHFDQYVVWVVGCFAGMMLPAAMSLKVIKLPESGAIPSMQVASMQAQGIADTFPDQRMLFWYLTIFTGFLIIWFTQVQVLDHVTRRWTDILWTGSAKARERSGGKVQKIYYSIAAAYALINCAVLVLNTMIGGTPFQILVLTAVSGGFAMMVSSFHTLYVNQRFLPKAVRASWWRSLGLALCGVFYLIMTVLAVSGMIYKEMNKKSAAAKSPTAMVARAERPEATSDRGGNLVRPAAP